MLFEVVDLLEVEGFDESEELIDGLIKIIINQSIREENRVISILNFCDRQLNPFLELFLRLNSIANSLSQLLERWGINKQKVALETGPVDIDGTLSVHLDNWNPSWVWDSHQLLFASAVKLTVDLFMFDEVFV